MVNVGVEIALDHLSKAESVLQRIMADDEEDIALFEVFAEIREAQRALHRAQRENNNAPG